MQIVIWITIAVVLLPAAIGLYLWSFRYVVRCLIVDREIRITFLGITVRRIPFDSIGEARVVPLRDFLPFSRGFHSGYLFAERWGGLCSKAVVIEKRGVQSGCVILSPVNPEEFASQIAADITAPKPLS
jgi:hypothetical protein